MMREKAELEAKVKRLEQDVYKLQLERDVLEKAGYKMSRPNVQKILYKNVQLVCLL